MLETANPPAETTPPEVIVLLRNYVRHNGSSGEVTGYSGASYGHAEWIGDCFEFRLPLSRWREIKQDISLLPLRWPNNPKMNWSVDFIVPDGATTAPRDAKEEEELISKIRNCVSREQVEAIACCLPGEEGRQANALLERHRAHRTEAASVAA